MTQAFNLSQFANKVNTSGQADLTTAVTGTLPVANGGTGITSAGSNGNVLTSNGTSWVSQAISAGGNYVMNAYVSPTTWTKPATIKAVKVTVIGGGGGSAANPNTNQGAGGGGGTAIEYIPAASIPGPVSVTVGAGGNGAAGGTSSYGAFCSATGGGSGPPGSVAGTGGAGSGGTVNMVGQAGINNSGGATFMAAEVSGQVNGLIYGGGSGPKSGGPGTALIGGTGVVIVEEFY